MVSFRKKFTNYKSFAKATMQDMLTIEELKDALILEANYMQSSYIENLGGGKFKIIPFPIEAQFAPVFGMVTGDFNTDGNLDVILNGNDYGVEVSQGRMDALNGLLLLGNGKGNFKAQTIAESGIYIPGDGKALVSLTNAKGLNLILASQNRGLLKCFKNTTPLKTIHLLPMDAYAIINNINGKKRKEEFYYGTSFLSQSERSLRINEKIIKSVEIVDFKGKRRVIK